MEAFNNLTQYLSEYSKGIKMKMLLNSVRPAKISCTGENISRTMTQKFKKSIMYQRLLQNVSFKWPVF